MVLNEEIKLSAIFRREDVWQENLILCGINIQKVSQIKYLGFEIDSKNKDDFNLQKRKQNANGSLAKLNLIGINSKYLSPEGSAFQSVFSTGTDLCSGKPICTKN